MEAVRSGLVFDIWAAGQEEVIENSIGRMLTIGSTVFEYVTTIVSFIHVVRIIRVGITVTKFVVLLLKEGAKNVAEGWLLDKAVGYLRETYGYSSVFRHTGWHLRCRICGGTHVRRSLADGEIVTCPNERCKAQARLRVNQ
ncbi:MAG TPA: hypothetical protein VF017_14735 [Thermoanaerobaculia bacterium]|nr:hypothetical protein [Thermoanaerobaculia bacterium]